MDSDKTYNVCKPLYLSCFIFCYKFCLQAGYMSFHLSVHVILVVTYCISYILLVFYNLSFIDIKNDIFNFTQSGDNSVRH